MTEKISTFGEIIEESKALSSEERRKKTLEVLKERALEDIEDPRIRKVCERLQRIFTPEGRRDFLLETYRNGVDVFPDLTDEEITTIADLDAYDTDQELQHGIQIAGMRQRPDLSEEERDTLSHFAYADAVFAGGLSYPLDELAILLAQEGLEDEAMNLLLYSSLEKSDENVDGNYDLSLVAANETIDGLRKKLWRDIKAKTGTLSEDEIAE